MSTPKPILSVRRLTVEYPVRGRWLLSGGLTVKAIDDLHFNLHAGETLCVTGESGCGKTTLARALAGLQPVTSGGMVFGGTDLARLAPDEWRAQRRRIQMVFADAVGSLDPRMPIVASVEEPLAALLPELDAARRRERALAWLERAGFPAASAQAYPHELDAAQCRLAGIARALAVEPELLIGDELLGGLDPAAQAAVLDLLIQLQRERGLALVLLARDLGPLRAICHRAVVLYLGRVMEQATCAELFAQPRHPYTRMLMGATPALPAEPIEPGHLPSGCVFRTRCPMADDLCGREVPYLRRVGDTAHVACHYVQGHDTPDVVLKEGVVGARRRREVKPEA